MILVYLLKIICMRKRNFKIVIGDKFKEWNVISEEFRKWGKRVYLCRCKCGKEQEMIRERLLSVKDHFMCHSCAAKINNAKKKGNGVKTVGDLGGTHLYGIKRGAESRNIEYSVTKEYLWDLFLSQNKKCALSGLPITLSNETRGRTPRYDLITASLDRIDSRFGYIQGNVQWVHKLANIMKSTLSEREFIYLCTKISKFRKANFEPSLEIGNFKYSRKAQRLTSDDFPSNNLDTSARHPVVLLDDDIV